MKEMEPTWAIISKGPRYFSASFLERWVVWMLFDLMETLSPILKSSGGVWCLLAETEYHLCTSDLWDQSYQCRSFRLTTNLGPW